MPSKYLNDARTGELIQKIYTADRAIATECKSYTDTNYLPLTGGTLTGAVNGVTPTAGDESTKLATTAYVREEVRQHSGIPVGHIYFSVNPNIPQGSLPLFGGEFSRETYSDLWAWVQQQAGYCKTEAEWQALATNNNNNVPYYSDGDGSTTFRVPSLRCWVKGADGTVVEVGSYLEAGLPNITGAYSVRLLQNQYDNILSPSNVFSSNRAAYGSNAGQATQSGTTTDTQKITFDASRSSSVYGNSATVQPESIVGMWLVKAYGTVVDTGTIDEQQYIDDRIAALPNTFLPLAGGTMTGAIAFSAFPSTNPPHIKVTSNGSSLAIAGGDEINYKGGRIVLYGTNSADTTNATLKGGFNIASTDGTNVHTLLGYNNGSLQWDSKEIERVNTNATGYVRYESGLQICWGTANSNNTGTASVSFPAAFASVPEVALTAGSLTSSASNAVNVQINSVSTTAFTIRVSVSGTWVVAYNHYIAIGKWK